MRGIGQFGSNVEYGGALIIMAIVVILTCGLLFPWATELDKERQRREAVYGSPSGTVP